MVDDSGGKPPPIIHYLSSVYMMRGGYLPFLELMGCFVSFYDYRCNKKCLSYI
jgi:hypothetical protein